MSHTLPHLANPLVGVGLCSKIYFEVHPDSHKVFSRCSTWMLKLISVRLSSLVAKLSSDLASKQDPVMGELSPIGCDFSSEHQ